MNRWPFIFIVLLLALASGCASGPKPVSKNTTLFDAANRLISTVTPMGRSNGVVFNHQSRPMQFTDQAGQQTTNTFDVRGRLVTRADSVGTTTNLYDANNHLTNVVENGKTNAWTYDAYNRVATYQDVNGYLIQYKYDANGNLTNLIYPGNRPVIYFYDNLNRLTNVTDWAQRQTKFTYDLASRLTGITRPNGTYRTISYDAAGQVSNVWEQMANALPIAWFRFNWTNSGDLNWEFAAPPPHTNTPPLRTMTYDADNRLATFNGPTMGSSQNVTVDADGNLTVGPLTSDAFTNYTYDARNRLLSAGGVTNAYDAINNRIGQTVGANTTVLVVNPNAALPQVLMRIKNGVTNYYVYGAGLMYQVTETATSTNTQTYHYDYRGSTIALSGDNGVPTDRMEYSLYGITTYRTGTNDTPFLFNGEYGVQTDPNGLLYMRSRYYNPYLCRFINSDPSGFGGGLNMYAFANGNPVTYLDPLGLGALGESALTDSYFNAPTALQTKIQNGLADFANLVTLGTADFASSAINGTDLKGNNLNFGDAFNQELESGAFVASLALSLPTDGASLEADSTLLGGRLAAKEAVSTELGTPPVNVLPSSGRVFYGTPPASGGQIIVGPPNYYPVTALNVKGLVLLPLRQSLGDNKGIIRYGDAGYVRYYNDQGQPLNPATGKSGPSSVTHIPINYQGLLNGYPGN